MRRLTSILCLLLLSGSCAAPPRSNEPSVTDLAEFRDLVLSRLDEQYPDRTFERTEDPQVLMYGESEIGLQNLWAKCQGDLLSPEQIDEIIGEHFDAMFDDIDLLLEMETISWESAQALVRPQLTPSEYLETMKMPNSAFCSGVVQTYVIDHENRYQYVTSEDLQRWGIPIEEVRRAAFENLDDATAGVGFQQSTGPDLFIALDTGDGYDAVRLLLPGIREFAAEKLGEPFLAAVPNRDFLIMWSETCSEEFNENARRSVLEDVNSAPYPLTPLVFQVTASGVVPLS